MEVCRQLLHLLEYDGYLEREGESYKFVSPMVGDWWKAHYGSAYIPAMQR